MSYQNCFFGIQGGLLSQYGEQGIIEMRVMIVNVNRTDWRDFICKKRLV